MIIIRLVIKVFASFNYKIVSAIDFKFIATFIHLKIIRLAIIT